MFQWESEPVTLSGYLVALHPSSMENLCYKNQLHGATSLSFEGFVQSRKQIMLSNRMQRRMSHNKSNDCPPPDDLFAFEEHVLNGLSLSIAGGADIRGDSPSMTPLIVIVSVLKNTPANKASPRDTPANLEGFPNRSPSNSSV